MFGIGAGGVVAQLANLPAGGVPHLVQVLQLRAEHRLGIAPDLDFAHAGAAGGTCHCGTGLANKMAVFAQGMVAQGLHDGVALRGFHLQQHAQFLAEQGLEREFFTPRTDLSGPVFAVAHFGAAVRDAIAFGDQQIDIERHAHVAGKGHFTGCGKQAAIAAVVVGEQLAILAQLVDGLDQIDQVLRVVQVGRLVAQLVQGLRQDAGAHAVFAVAQIDQHQGGVRFGRVELWRERAAHIGQSGEGGDDQADRADDLFGSVTLVPHGAHRQRILAHGDRNAQRRAQFQPDGFDCGIQGRVFARLAAGRHPVGGEFDAIQFNRRRKQVGDGLGHSHAA